MAKTTPDKTIDGEALMIKAYKDRALAYQITGTHFIVAYYCKTILVNLLVDADELEVVIHKLRNKNKLVVDFNWMADR